MSKLKIGLRLALGFAAVLLLCGSAIGFVILKIHSASETAARVRDLRAPVASTSLKLAGATTGTANLLRGFIITRDSSLTDQWVAQWRQVDQLVATMDSLSASFTDPANRAAWTTVRTALPRFREAQGRTFAVVERGTIDDAARELQANVLPLFRALQTELVGADGNGGLSGAQSGLLQSDIDATTGGISTASMAAVAALVAAILIGALIALLSARSITVPLGRVRGVLDTMAAGDYHVEVPAIDRSDEVGDIARAALVFKENGLEAQRLRDEQAAARARAEAEHKAMMNRMADDFEGAVGAIVTSVSDSAGHLKAAASTMTGAATEASAQSNAVAAASEESSTNIQTVAAATEEMVSSVREIAGQVENSARMATDAVRNADHTASQVQDLADKVQKIGEIVELISGVAAQTNLLALNATIEAARAGEAGRGFAVVASEVKGLADQTAKATTEIATQINAIQEATQSSSQSIGSITRAIRDMSQVSTDIAAAVEEQTAATSEISRNVQQASTGAHEVATNIVGVSQAVAETGAAAAQVLSSADGLAEQATRLRRELDQFLGTVRAA
ncbi:methyl-accepting chemotaxis protein [Phreatobacter sp. HK31-P]